MKKLVELRGVAHHFEIDSAGTYPGHAGQLPNPPMREAGTRRGYAMTHRARPFTKEDFGRFDMIVVMDDMNYRNVTCIGNQEDAKKVRRMASFCSRFTIDHVPDPYRAGAEVFEQTLDILEDGCEGIYNYLAANRAF